VKTKATYESVIAAIARLKENRQEPTLDAILSITGGSKGTVHKHWNRYKEEHRSFQAIEGGLSAVIQNAIMAEITSKISEAKIQLETDLCEEKAVSLSLADSNEKQEAVIDELQDKIFKLEALLAKAQGRYEQADKEAQTERKKAEQSRVKLTEFSLKLEASENNLGNMKKQNADDKLQLTQYQEKATQSEKQAAVAAQQVSDLNQRFNEQIEARQQQTTLLLGAQKTIEEQNVELKELEKAKAQAEQTAVIAQVKLEHAGNRDPVQAH
jgi:chromosome segregation ATPase